MMMRTYLKYCLTIITFSFALISLLILFIYSTGEMLHIETITDKQLDSNRTLLYGTALHRNTEHYKMLMLEKINPEVLALGSSRVMQFRQHMFKSDFYNLGGLMVANHDVHNIFPKINSIQPKIVLLGVDFWWFHDNWNWNKKSYYEKYSIHDKKYTDPKLNLSHIKNILKWFFYGEISINKIYSQMTGLVSQNIGISGIYNDGFAKDGSIYNTREATGEKKIKDVLFNRTIKEITNNKNRGKFQYSTTLNPKRVQVFLQLIKDLEERGIYVITYLPPFANEVNNEIKKLGKKYSYIDQLRLQLHNSGINFYDFSKPSTLNANSCEFLDGYHSGEVLSMRILNQIAKTDIRLKKYININVLASKIDNNKGHWFVPNPNITQLKEIDFLKIGCIK